MTQVVVDDRKHLIRQRATAAELVRIAKENIGSAAGRVHDRNIERNFFTAESYLIEPLGNLAADLSEDDLEAAYARVMMESVRRWRDKLERDESAKKALPAEFINLIFDLAREADHLIHTQDRQ